MISRIHILGASGSGTSTLAESISKEWGYEHFDTDDYFWEPTHPPYRQKREVEERIKLLRMSIEESRRWVLSGSLCGWGDVFIPYFDLVIYLWLPQEIRINRLLERERKRYGKEIEEGGLQYKESLIFMDWASQYDTGDLSIRSRMLHEDWLANINCHILRIEEDIELEDKLQRVLRTINRLDFKKIIKEKEV